MLLWKHLRRNSYFKAGDHPLCLIMQLSVNPESPDMLQSITAQLNRQICGIMVQLLISKAANNLNYRTARNTPHLLDDHSFFVFYFPVHLCSYHYMN